MINRFTKENADGFWIADSADVVGEVTIGKNSCIWYGAVVRGDTDSIAIGSRTNVQDGSIIHTDAGFKVEIGDDVTIGHAAIVHGCTVGSNTLIGMGAIILNGAKIGKNCIIGAGALVTQGTVIPDGSMAFGSPAKVVRQLKPEEIEANTFSAVEYEHLAKINFD